MIYGRPVELLLKRLLYVSVNPPDEPWHPVQEFNIGAISFVKSYGGHVPHTGFGRVQLVVLLENELGSSVNWSTHHKLKS